MWSSGYAQTDTYNLIAQLNQLRNFLVDTTTFATDETQVLTESPYGLAIMKGQVISIMTNIGSPVSGHSPLPASYLITQPYQPQNGTQISVSTPYEPSSATINILTCQEWVIGSSGNIDVEYTKGGRPVVLVPTGMLRNSGICTGQSQTDTQFGGTITGAGPGVNSSAMSQGRWSLEIVFGWMVGWIIWSLW